MRSASLFTFGVIFLTSATAFGDPAGDARLAQALFDEGRALMGQGRYAEACPKLAESQRLDPGGGTLLNLALCHANEGRTATALVEYQEALALAMRDGRADREKLARASIVSLEKDVPRMTVEVAEGARAWGLVVTLDETRLDRAAWGVATPVDPGSHVVRATVGDGPPWSAFVAIDAGEKKTVVIPASAFAAPRDPAPLPRVTEPAREMHHGPEARETRANPVFWAAVGVTALAAGVMTVTGIMALSANRTANDGCLQDRGFCRTQEARDAAEATPTLAWISTGALVIGVIGGISLFTIPARRDVGVAIAPMGVRGTF